MIKKDIIVKSISAKEVWANNETNRIEEQKMSPFIAEVIDDISEITGYDLEVISMEQFIGDFRADIICKDIHTDDIVVIENQLENSDHDHLGKSLTYFSNIGAKSIVWICENFRPEHIKSIETLNEITGNEYNFYAIELKFESYNNTEPYYYFNKVVVPTYISKISQSLKNNNALSDDMKDICQFLDKFETELKPKIHSVNHQKNKQYCKISTYKPGIYFGVGYTIKGNKFVFEISKNNCTETELNNIQLKVDELNKKYNFVYSLGKKNKVLHKFLYEVELDYTNENDIQKLMDICIDIHKIMLKK